MTKAHMAGQSAKVAPVLRTKKKKKRKSKASQRKAISEIKKYQQGKYATATLIPKSCFARLARKTAATYRGDLRFQDDALSGLQTACESYLIELLNNGNKIATCSGRMTLQANDIRLAHSISTGSEFNMITEEEKKIEETQAAAFAAQEDSAEDDLSPGEEEEDEGDYSGDSEDDEDDDIL